MTAKSSTIWKPARGEGERSRRTRENSEREQEHDSQWVYQEVEARNNGSNETKDTDGRDNRRRKYNSAAVSQKMMEKKTPPVPARIIMNALKI